MAHAMNGSFLNGALVVKVEPIFEFLDEHGVNHVRLRVTFEGGRGLKSECVSIPKDRADDAVMARSAPSAEIEGAIA